MRGGNDSAVDWSYPNERTSGEQALVMSRLLDLGFDIPTAARLSANGVDAVTPVELEGLIQDHKARGGRP